MCAQVDAADGEVAAPGGRPMGFEEKRRLSQALGGLPADKLGLVMEIIAESQPLDLVRSCAAVTLHGAAIELQLGSRGYHEPAPGPGAVPAAEQHACMAVTWSFR